MTASSLIWSSFFLGCIFAGTHPVQFLPRLSSSVNNLNVRRLAKFFMDLQLCRASLMSLIGILFITFSTNSCLGVTELLPACDEIWCRRSLSLLPIAVEKKNHNLNISWYDFLVRLEKPHSLDVTGFLLADKLLSEISSKYYLTIPQYQNR